MTPDKQHLADIPNLYDMIISGGAGLATGVLHDLYIGRRVSLRKMAIKAALSIVIYIGLTYIMDALQVPIKQQVAIAFFCGAVGPDVVVALFQRKKELISRGLDVLEEKVKI